MGLTSLFASLVAIANAPSNWTVGGFVDTYYGYLDGGLHKDAMLAARQFSERDCRSPRLAQTQLNLTYKSSHGRFSAFVSPTAGDNVAFMRRVTPGKSQALNYLSQAYVTWAEPKRNFTVDLGKFYTWIGYEGPESMSNDVYTRGVLWTICEPTYNVGGRVSAQIDRSWGASAYVVTGWNQVGNSRNRPVLGGQVRYNPNALTSLTLGYIGGDEGGDTLNRFGGYGGIGFPNPDIARVHLGDMIVTYQATSKLKLVVNGDYASSGGEANSGTWWGAAGYARYQVTSRIAVTLRSEAAEDVAGLRLGQPARVQAVTLGADYALGQHHLFRLEVRQDSSDRAIFNCSDGSAKTQTTVTASYAVRL